MSFRFSIEEVEQMLNEIAQRVPDEFFRHLNGGVILIEEYKPHFVSEKINDENSTQNEGGLVTLGTYNRDSLGRYICIYYGSFARAFANATEYELREELEETLLHEFTHHLESLAGERGLEIKDKIRMNEYLKNREKRKN